MKNEFYFSDSKKNKLYGEWFKNESFIDINFTILDNYFGPCHLFPPQTAIFISLSLYRKVQSLGLKKLYYEDKNLKKFIRNTLSVGFSPLCQMGPKMGDLCDLQTTTELLQK